MQKTCVKIKDSESLQSQIQKFSCMTRLLVELKTTKIQHIKKRFRVIVYTRTLQKCSFLANSHEESFQRSYFSWEME